MKEEELRKRQKQEKKNMNSDEDLSTGKDLVRIALRQLPSTMLKNVAQEVLTRLSHQIFLGVDTSHSFTVLDLVIQEVDRRKPQA